MEQFIEVHIKQEKRLINLRWVEEIHENQDGSATIYFAFNCPNAIDQDYMKVDESYNEVFRKFGGKHVHSRICMRHLCNHRR